MECLLKGGCVNGLFIVKFIVVVGYGNYLGYFYGCNSWIERISVDLEIYLSGFFLYLLVFDNLEIDKLKK